MERVETLLKKLQQQFNNGASAGQLLLTAQMLQHELAHLQLSQAPAPAQSIIVTMPPQPMFPLVQDITNKADKAETEEKTIEILEVDEAELEAELEEIKRNAAVIHKISVLSKPHILFDEADDIIPTLAHQDIDSKPREINETVSIETTSLNDSLKEDGWRVKIDAEWMPEWVSASVSASVGARVGAQSECH